MGQLRAALAGITDGAREYSNAGDHSPQKSRKLIPIRMYPHTPYRRSNTSWLFLSTATRPRGWENQSSSYFHYRYLQAATIVSLAPDKRRCR